MEQKASWIATVTGGTLHGPDVAITGSVQTDSRLCGEGSLYIARVGENADGHDYADAAVESGATCLVVERPLPLAVAQVVVSESTRALGDIAKAHLASLRNDREITVIGITGSVGKTTTKDLLGQILGAQAPTVFPQLSFNNEVGCPLTILTANSTTRFLVLEMGASGIGHIEYLTDIAPLDVACVLMVGSAHLGGFGSLDAVRQAKSELVAGLVSRGKAVLNADDPAVRSMASTVEQENILWFSKGDAADIHTGKDGVQFTYRGRLVRSSLVGAHQIMNILAAIRCAEAVGVTLDDSVQALSASKALSPHRMVVRDGVKFAGVSDLRIIDDSYNANPDSLRAGLDSAAMLSTGRLIVVLGEMLELGEESDKLHRQAAKDAVLHGADILIAIGEGLRVVEKITDSPTTMLWCRNAAEATKLLEQVLRAGDTVFVKGSNGSGAWRVADSLLVDVQ